LDLSRDHAVEIAQNHPSFNSNPAETRVSDYRPTLRNGQRSQSSIAPQIFYGGGSCESLERNETPKSHNKGISNTRQIPSTSSGKEASTLLTPSEGLNSLHTPSRNIRSYAESVKKGTRNMTPPTSSPAHCDMATDDHWQPTFGGDDDDYGFRIISGDYAAPESSPHAANSPQSHRSNSAKRQSRRRSKSRGPQGSPTKESLTSASRYRGTGRPRGPHSSPFRKASSNGRPAFHPRGHRGPPRSPLRDLSSNARGIRYQSMPTRLDDRTRRPVSGSPPTVCHLSKEEIKDLVTSAVQQAVALQAANAQPQARPHPPETVEVPEPGHNRQRPATAGGDQDWRLRYPENPDNVSPDQRLPDMRLIQIGRKANPYQRHLRAPFVFNRGGALSRDYRYLAEKRDDRTGALLWDRNKSRRLDRWIRPSGPTYEVPSP